LTLPLCPADCETLSLSKRGSSELCLLTVPPEDTVQNETENRDLQTIACNTTQARDCQSALNGCLDECVHGQPDAKCQQACETNYEQCKVAAGCP
jgi:hypothetical protein